MRHTPSSNVHTGVAPTIKDHPIKLLRDLRFRVTLNTDNRLMSDCSMSSEMQAVVDAFDLPVPVVAFEIDADRLRSARRTPRRSTIISRFPASIIDLAFVVDDRVPAADILATLRESAGPLLERVELFDVFRSDTIGAGRVSLAFTISFRAPDRTLTDDEVAALRTELIAAVTKRHGAELRA